MTVRAETCFDDVLVPIYNLYATRRPSAAARQCSFSPSLSPELRPPISHSRLVAETQARVQFAGASPQPRHSFPTLLPLSAAIFHHLIPSQKSHEVHSITPVNSHFSLPSLSVQHSFSSAPFNQKKLSPFTGPPLYSGRRSPRCGWMSGCHCARNVIARTSPFVSEKPLNRFAVEAEVQGEREKNTYPT